LTFVFEEDLAVDEDTADARARFLSVSPDTPDPRFIRSR
jgi:hypothetical protein